MNRLCALCNRPVWDGGGALSDTRCAEPNELLCRAIEALGRIVVINEEKRAINPKEEETWRIARSVLVLAGIE